MCACVTECGGGGAEMHDLLTCGDCLEEFPLSDIVRFISHKVSHGGGRCTTSSPRAIDDNDDEQDMTTRPAWDREQCPGSGLSEEPSQRSPSRHLVCDSSLPGDEGAAADNRLNGDMDDCFNHLSTSSGQLNTVVCLSVNH